ncbi:phytanoyl-CoA dioxygenase family protein [Horticoccus luteus]|uniref:Phytanoyl-CoA dioxygenase family protein n=1 Tax=Horticoccus luteus TaxID=2862869 RepID=A0A8F9TUV5_9BACT|nr:phytanoyl-CoA dioxygenase family protein [Horticoccus luteus]QYM79531.1 phytanoyl-CoA dioxygenase family protein [Horticoccus luteus]
MLTYDQVQLFDRDGYVLVPDVFTPQEIEILVANVGGARTKKHEGNMPDAAGRSSKLSLWADIGDDVFGAVSASPRVVNNARILLREEVYHWHSKVMLKEPRVGGAWEWHQDYGYWYGDGCLYPRMISCMIALDAATRENGCLKVIPGSHLLGRFDHGRVGQQAGADQERVAAVAERLGVVYCEAPAGSALFFHGNTFHASEANLSDRPRRAYICCYNAFSNVPYGGHGHGRPEPIAVAPDDAILRFTTASEPTTAAR